MGEHERMKVCLEDGTTFCFVKFYDETAGFSMGPYPNRAIISSIHAVIGEPLTFTYGIFRHYDYKSDTNVKDIKYDVPYDA